MTDETNITKRLVIVDDEEDNLATLERTFRTDFTVETFPDPREGLKFCHKSGLPDALIVDLKMPHLTGIEFLKALNGYFGDTDHVVKILLTGYAAVQDTIDSINVGRIDYCATKPYQPKNLAATVQRLIALKGRERRQAARVPVPRKENIRVASRGDTRHTLGDLGSSGIFVHTKHLYEKGAEIPFEIRLPGGEVLAFTGRVARVDANRQGVGVAFVDPDPTDLSALERLVRDHYQLQDYATLTKKYPFLKLHELVLFSEADSISRMVSRLVGTNNLTVVPGYNERRIAARVATVDEPGGTLILTFDDSAEMPHVGESVLVSATDSTRTIGFETILLRVDAERREAQVIYPRAVFHADRRRWERISTPTNKPLVLDIALQHPEGATMACRVLDRSEDGLAVFVPQEKGLLFPGAPLPSVRVLSEDQVEWAGPAEVRHVSAQEINGELGLVVGIQLGLGRIKPLERDAANLKPRVRVPTESAVSKSETGVFEVVRFPNPDGLEMVGLLNLVPPSRPGEEVPVVILQPGLGKTKEVLFALALTLECTFRQLGLPVAILRYDGVHKRGESYHDPDCLAPERQSLRMTLRQGAKDIEGALNYVNNNPRFKPSATFLVTFSLSTLDARLLMRDPEKRKQVDHWIVCMGYPEIRRVVTRISANFDIMEACKLGMRLGVTDFLGISVDADRFFAEALADGVDDFPRAREDLAKITAPITWLLGEHDHWVDAEWVRDVLTANPQGPRELIMTPLGHTVRSSKEALRLFGIVTETICRHIGVEETVTLPDEQLMTRVRSFERDRLPPPQRSQLTDYWQRYLLGQDENLGFDTLTYSDDYQAFMVQHAKAMGVEAHHVVLEIGAGTGNLLLSIGESGGTLPQRWVVTDLVEAALAKAKSKHAASPLSRNLALDYVTLDIEINPFSIIRNLLAGEYFSITVLRDLIGGAHLDSLEKLQRRMDPELYHILRGADLLPSAEQELQQSLDWDVFEILMDLNRASRIVKGAPVTGRFRRLDLPDDPEQKMRWPFGDASFDRIVASLVFPYVGRPTESLREARRVLRPGGRLVFSTMNPDPDTSGIFVRMIERLEKLPADQLKGELEHILRSARHFLNDAARLADLEEQGMFEFFTHKQLHQMCREAGFKSVELVAGFGSPPQATIAIAEV